VSAISVLCLAFFAFRAAKDGEVAVTQDQVKALFTDKNVFFYRDYIQVINVTVDFTNLKTGLLWYLINYLIDVFL
jgi:hypothetical protein